MGSGMVRRRWVKWMLRRRSRFNRLQRPFEYRAMRNWQERVRGWWGVSPADFKPQCLSEFKPDKQALRFLILEHQVDMARALCTLFQFEFKPAIHSEVAPKGYRAVVCWVVSSAGPDAKNILHAVRSLRPHLITLEPRLPGARGMELVQRLRNENKATPVVIISTSNVSDEIQHAFNVGAAGYFLKPFDPETLMARIHTLLEEAGPIDIEAVRP